MKKAFLALMILCGMAAAFTGCKPELKTVRGQVASIEIGTDSTMMPTKMILTIDGKDKVVSLADVRFQNGIALQGDSIILDYIDGKENTLRGLVVTILPKPAQTFEPTDTLIMAAPTDSIQ